MVTARSQPAVRPAPGRPRSLRAKRAVLNAARELIEKDGYTAASIEAVAARSGVAKTTIYRWWPNQAALVVELLFETAAVAAPAPSTSSGDPMRALLTEIRLIATAAESLAGRLLTSLLGAAAHDPDIHEALMRGLFRPRRKATAKVIRQAQAAGLIRRDLPPQLIADVLYGPLFYRKFVRHEPVGRGLADRVFEAALAGLRPRAARRK